MSHAVGSLVEARGREWVVLPGSDDELLLLQPLGGSAEETAGILTSLEEVVPARFPLPAGDDLGDARSARLLLEALRLGFRCSAGPFRCFGSLAFEPRPYQLVPLLMALRLDPVRLLIADDVGTGKTAAALLVAAELLAQGSALRLAVLCPPHLAEQWQDEMAAKFGLEAELVLPATASRLERSCRTGESIFDRHPVTVVSTEYVKADRRRAEFLHSAPDLIVVDEAHTCASGVGRGRHQRHQMVADLAADPERHLVLVTATPHSGDEQAFRSLLALLDPAFADLPEDLAGDANQGLRRRLARHLVQRRRGDLRSFLADTPFPDRLSTEATYHLSPPEGALYDAVFALATERIHAAVGDERARRVQWWSVLALLRALASSPAAAAASLRARAAHAHADDPEAVDRLGAATLFDELDDETVRDADPGTRGTGAPSDGEEAGDEGLPDGVAALVRAAEGCMGDVDSKLADLVTIVRQLMDDDYHPIVFCRFIATAGYVAAHLRTAFGEAAVEAVTGAVPPTERAAVVARLGSHERRILVATDCLSEGINLQDHFDAVVHYDLSWNPTRHEQREGRVDRFGQRRPAVRVVTYYGADNRVDDLVLRVLHRKHAAIRTSLGVSIPVPGDPNVLAAALLGRLLGATDPGKVPDAQAEQLAFDTMAPEERLLLDSWDSAAERERRSRTVFAQEAIRPQEVAAELSDVAQALGTPEELRRFVADAVTTAGGAVVGAPGTIGDGGGGVGTESDGQGIVLHLVEAPLPVREAAGGRTELALAAPTERPGAGSLLQRTDPFVRGLAAWVLDAALDPLTPGPARRASVIRTDAVQAWTTLLLLRFRFDMTLPHRRGARSMLVEDAGLAAFRGLPTEPEWLDQDATSTLLTAAPAGNVLPTQAREYLRRVVLPEAETVWRPALHDVARRRADELLAAHQRARQTVRRDQARNARVVAPFPPDVLGIFCYLPAGGG